jgi:hypothetical protein
VSDDERAFATSTTALSRPAQGDVVVAGRTATSRPGYLRTIAITFGSIASVPIALLFFGAGFFPGVIALFVAGGIVLRAMRSNASLFYPVLTVEIPPEPFRITGDDAIVVKLADGGAGKLERLVVTAKIRVLDTAHEDDDGAIFNAPILSVPFPERGSTWRIAPREGFPGVVVGGRRAVCEIVARLYVPWFPDAVAEVSAPVE